jgi:hypothetical protein
VNFQRVHKLVDIQEQLEGGVFPDGACFVHANAVGHQHFRLKRITGIDLDSFQVSLEIYGDDDLEEGIVVLPLEVVEWFGFPARAVPTTHFEGFVGLGNARGGAVVRPPRAEGSTKETADAGGDGEKA